MWGCRSSRPGAGLGQGRAGQGRAEQGSRRAAGGQGRAGQGTGDVRPGASVGASSAHANGQRRSRQFRGLGF